MTDTSRWRPGRIAAAVLLGEAIPIAMLVALVAATGHAGETSAESGRRAQALGLWVGPVGGAIVAALLGAWVGRPVPARALAHAGATGIGIALLDVAILAATGAPFAWLFVASNLGKVAAALLGGAWRRSRVRAAPA